MGIFTPTDILLPEKTELTKWAVIACDQFSSQDSYWEELETLVGEAPSALRMIVPEAYLRRGGLDERVRATYAAMEKYTRSGLFRRLENALIYVRRTLSDGSVRHGVVGAVDLEAYDYAPGTSAPIRASERTVASRLPVRMEIRSGACLEMPHIMTLISDPQRRLIEGFEEKLIRLEKLYDFELNQGGGRIEGYLIPTAEAEAFSFAVDALPGDVKMIIGDGNHSLAAAREYWLELKKTLLPGQTHPARYALCEVNNVYDPAVTFHAIHRAAFGVEPEKLIAALESAYPGKDYTVACLTADGERTVTLAAESIGQLIGRVDAVLERELPEGGRVDYVHDAAAAAALAKQSGAAAFLLPSMTKDDFFATVIRSGLFPKKSFSIGVARDKRYYLECRAIRQ